MRLLLGVYLSAEVDREADSEHHHQAREGEPDADRAALVSRVHECWRQVSRGLDMVACSHRVPGMPGTVRSDRSSRQLMVTLTVAGCPAGAWNPVVSTLTVRVRQCTCWADRSAVAAVWAS